MGRKKRARKDRPRKRGRGDRSGVLENQLEELVRDALNLATMNDDSVTGLIANTNASDWSAENIEFDEISRSKHNAFKVSAELHGQQLPDQMFAGDKALLSAKGDIERRDGELRLRNFEITTLGMEPTEEELLSIAGPADRSFDDIDESEWYRLRRATGDFLEDDDGDE